MNATELFEAIMHELGIGKEFKLAREGQNDNYEGCILQVNSNFYRTRLAKLTPKKKGYFVAIWEKDKEGNNQPYNYQESPEKLIVSIIDRGKCGQFIFPKDVLLKYGVLKNAKHKGKMAVRVYPNWLDDLTATASKTQAWQARYFIDLSDGYDVEKLRALYFF
ncbi:MepB family protein [Amphibacillus jilinensis]|uniref:MepB family protein n=1 Tax=Amphibacillus jilinensis TaxID=1216008 RepID=UPI0002FACC0B|nr:MepB family protein [Amphibacillus jilinensis]